MIKITKHAKNRIKERLGLWQFYLLARTALNSVEKTPKWFSKKELTALGFTTYIYRTLRGNVYVFRKEGDNFILLTVYKSHGKNIFQKLPNKKTNKRKS